MKDTIIRMLDMEKVLSKYGVKTSRGMFCCPFHGDKNPSAKAYDKTYHCFTCNCTGDLIQFVEDYFKLDFKEAMQKLNLDFGLGLDSFKVNINKIREIKQQEYLKDKKEKEIKNMTKRFCFLCDLRNMYKNLYYELKSKISTKNWENIEYVTSRIKTKIFLLSQEIEILNDNIYIKQKQ